MVTAVQRPLHTSRGPLRAASLDSEVANGQRCGTGIAGAAAIETNDDGGVAESSKGRRLMKPTAAVGPKAVRAAVCMQMQSGQRRRSAWAAWW
jgi:hypothetical protein